MKNKNYLIENSLSVIDRQNRFRLYVLLILTLCCNHLFAQQPSGSHVSSYNFTQGTATFFEQNGVVAPFKTTLATGAAAFTSTSNAFLLPTGFTYTINGTSYLGAAGTTGNAFVINSNGWIAFNNNGTINSISSLAATTTAPLTSATFTTAANGVTSSATNQGNGAIFSAMGRALVANAAGANGIANGSECYVVTYADGLIVVEWRNMKPSSTTTGRIDYQFLVFPDNYLGNGLKASVQYRYANCSFTGTASTAQVGVRGWGAFGDEHMRVGTAWNATTAGANFTSTLTSVPLSATVFPATNQAFIFTPCTVAPAFAALPYTQGFESTWLNSGCGTGITQDIPDNSWRSGPLFGETSWRRNGAGATAFWLNTASGTPPAGFTGTGFAQFHTFAGNTTNIGQIGVMDLFLNIAGGSANLDFDAQNTSGTDVLRIRLSTNGGLTFPTVLATIGVNASWTHSSISISGNATTVLRFEATGDWGSDDIGLDNVSVTVPLVIPNCATSFSPANGATNTCKNITLSWASGGNSPSGYRLTFGTNSPNYDNIQNNFDLGNVLSYNAGVLSSSTTYGYKIVPYNGNGDASGCSFNTFTTGTSICYCTPSTVNGGTGGDAIITFVCANAGYNYSNSITPPTGQLPSPGYADFTAITGTLARNSTNPFSISMTDAGDAARIWIDYNDNGSFDDAGELLATTTAGTSVSGNIVISPTAALGNHRLRVRNTYTTTGLGGIAIASITGCGPSSGVNYGESKDFTITIVPPPAPLISTFNPQNSCGGGTVIITGNYFTGATAVSFGGTAAASFVVNSATQITAVVSNSGSTGVIEVTTPDGSGQSGSNFTFDGAGPTASIQEGSSAVICSGLSQTFTALPGGLDYVWSNGETTQSISASTQGAYTVTVTSGVCAVTTSANLTVSPAPSAVSINPDPGLICLGGTTPVVFTASASSTLYSETFETGSGTPYAPLPAGWVVDNNSPAGGSTTWFQGGTGTTFPSHSGAVTGYIAANFNATIGVNTISDWLIMPNVTMNNGDVFTFWTRRTTSTFPDRLQVRSSSNGASVNTGTLPADVGDFTNLLLDINPTYTVAGYPSAWTLYTVTISGLSGPTSGRLAFRYFVENGGPDGANSDFIGIDDVEYKQPTLTYGWSGGTPSGNTTSTITPGPYTVTVTGSFGCTATASSSLNTIPHPTGVISGGPTVCVGNPSSVSIAVTGTGPWSGTITPGAIPFSGNTSPISVPVTPGTTTNYTIATLDDAGTGCSADAGDLSGTGTVNVEQLPTGTITSAAIINACPGDPVHITGTVTSSSSWTVYLSDDGNTPQASGTGNDNFDIIVNPTGDFSYSIASIETPLCEGTSFTGSSDVVHYDVPTATLSGTDNICQNTSSNGLSISFTGTGPWNYTITDGSYSLSGSSAVSPATVTIPANVLSVGAHTFSISALSDALCTGTGSGSGLVNSVSATALTGKFISSVVQFSNAALPAAACNGEVYQIKANGIVPFFGLTYNWSKGTNSGNMQFSTSSSGPWSNSLSTTSNDVYVQFGAISAGFSGYRLCVQAQSNLGNCQSTLNYCPWIQGSLSTPGPITGGATTLCTPATVSYSCGSSVGATQYRWTFPGMPDVITTNPNASLDLPAFATTGQLCVKAELGCGAATQGASRCVTLTHQLAAVGPMTAPATACPGSSNVLFSVAALAGAESYTWALPSGVTTVEVAPLSNSVHLNFPANYAGAPNVCVTAGSSCSTPQTRCKTMPSGTPATPGTVTGPASNICNSTVQYTIANVAGATSYLWTLPSGTSINSASSNGNTSILIDVSPTFVSGNLSVVASNSNCTPTATSLARTIPISGKPGIPGTITANPTVWCNGGFVNFSITPVSPLPTYNWGILNSGASIDAGQGSTNIDVVWGTVASGTVYVTASNSCGTSSTRSQVFTSIGSCREGQFGNAADSKFNVYPNPAHDQLTVQFNATTSENCTITVTDLSGRVISSREVTASEGDNTLNMDFTQIAKGVYMLEVKSNSVSNRTRVVVE